MITILREDESEEQIMIDPSAQHPMHEMQTANKKVKVFNPTKGNYGVTVTIGPSYATKRIEASENMMLFAKAMPNVASIVADLIVKNQDWEGADEMARRLAKAVPPQLLTPDQKDVPPQMQAFIQSQTMQIQQLTQQLQAAAKQLNDQEADRKVDLEKINKDYEAKLLAVVQKVEAVRATHGDADAKQFTELAKGVKTLMDLLNGSEAPHLKVQKDLTDKMEKTHKDMLAKLEGVQKSAESKLEDVQKKTSDQIEKVHKSTSDRIEKTDKRLSETSDHHKKIEENVKGLEKIVKTPRKIKIKRGSDGLIQEAVSEHGE
jgi:hypothetical protein